ncbi:flagellar hook-basal body complex protein FliE [Microvirga massiliensis]|uniref:flagellar hook-basal body complex protein FliE n=1 Tax=Microvirga massiliensis TaxID=1033741 RepID=UPI00062BA840|nr:flagellar hook-basal body complex protein FliE [Microvirga massiliensis]
MISAASSISSMIDRVGPSAGVQSGGGQGIAGAAAAAGAVSGAGATSFGDMMAQVASKAVDTLKAGEAASIQGIQGKASVQQVVEAVMSAEQTLQTAIAIRDKVVAAYQEISRMAI